MVQAFTFRLEGSAALVAGLRAYQLQKRGEVGGLIARYATLIAREARANAPYDEGELRAGIRAIVTDAYTALSALVVAEAPHSAFLEFGTGGRGAASGVEPPEGYDYGPSAGMPAQPYLRPALERHTPAFLRELRSILSS